MPKINTRSGQGLPIFKILKLKKENFVLKFKIFQNFQNFKIRKISKKFKIFIRFQNLK
jgi:hypothetical protein